MLQEAIQPHIDSYNAVFESNGLLTHALKDIGWKTILDGDDRLPANGRNRLSVRIKEVFVAKAQLPTSNKFSTRNREILPAECRERHATYRGRMSARLEYKINDGDVQEILRDLGQVPIMLKVVVLAFRRNDLLRYTSPPSATSRRCLPLNWYKVKKKQRNWADTSL